MPITRSGIRGRAQRPRSISAVAVSATTMADPAPDGRPMGQVGRSTRGDRRGDEVVAVALRHDGHEQLTRLQRPGIERGAVQLDVPTYQRAAGRLGHGSGREPHAAEPNRSGRTIRRWPTQPTRPTSAKTRTTPTARTDPDPPDGRINLVVLFGGQSAEHDVSRVTAAHVLRAADPARYAHHRGRHQPGRPVAAGRGRRRRARRRSTSLRRCRPGSRSRGRRRRPDPSWPPPRTPGRRWSSRSCTDRSARTGPSRGCWSWPTCPMSAAGCSARRWPWTRPWPSRSWPTTASIRPAGWPSGSTRCRPGPPARSPIGSDCRCS